MSLGKENIGLNISTGSSPYRRSPMAGSPDRHAGDSAPRFDYKTYWNKLQGKLAQQSANVTGAIPNSHGQSIPNSYGTVQQNSQPSLSQADLETKKNQFKEGILQQLGSVEGGDESLMEGEDFGDNLDYPNDMDGDQSYS